MKVLILKNIILTLLGLKIGESEFLEAGARRRCGIVEVVVLTIHSARSRAVGVSRSVIKNYAVDLTCRNEWREMILSVIMYAN